MSFHWNPGSALFLIHFFFFINSQFSLNYLKKLKKNLPTYSSGFLWKKYTSWIWVCLAFKPSRNRSTMMDTIQFNPMIVIVFHLLMTTFFRRKKLLSYIYLRTWSTCGKSCSNNNEGFVLKIKDDYLVLQPYSAPSFQRPRI